MGLPARKSELISHALDELYPGDTFNLITFSGDTHILFPEPVFPTAENIRKAKALLSTRTGGGGTEMMKAIRASLAPSDSQDHLRVVCFLTDGNVGNDLEVQLWLTDDSSTVLEQLKALGFTMSEARPKGRIIVGHLAADKLANIVKIGAVQFVAPVRR